jgi:hypothetical protein
MREEKMLLKPSVLEERGISAIRQPADGDYMDMDAVELSVIDRRLVEAAQARPEFDEVYAYAGPERYWADATRTSGASMQMLYSDKQKLAVILYHDPALSDVVISWVTSDDPATALHIWSAEHHAGGAVPVAAGDAPN